MLSKFVILIALISFSWHKYYVSITEAEYSAKSKTFQISLKFIGHDLEHSLEKEGAPELYLGTTKEKKNANAYLSRYINAKFKLIADGQELPFKFIGKEINNDDFIYCYIESKKMEIPKKLEIENSLLTDLFPEQSNIMYLKIGDKKYTFNFNRSKFKATQLIK